MATPIADAPKVRWSGMMFRSRTDYQSFKLLNWEVVTMLPLVLQLSSLMVWVLSLPSSLRPTNTTITDAPCSHLQEKLLKVVNPLLLSVSELAKELFALRVTSATEILSVQMNRVSLLRTRRHAKKPSLPPLPNSRLSRLPDLALPSQLALLLPSEQLWHQTLDSLWLKLLKTWESSILFYKPVSYTHLTLPTKRIV